MTRLLVLIGSGETSPTAVTLHQELRKVCGGHRLLLVETPYGFQENADEVSAKAARYFARSVGAEVEVVPGIRAPADQPGLDLDRGIAALRSGAWLFAGPGSPSYAARHWSGSPVGRILRDRLRREGVTVFASAAACVAGRVALPVYEIYKGGLSPVWIEALDMLAEAGIDAAVIPHYDNTEGGTHDTRYCYMGERRLRQLERQLPANVGVLGIDEHTAALFDLERETLTVRGRGVLTVRRNGSEKRFAAGATISFSEVRELLAGPWPAPPARERTAAPQPEPGGAEPTTLDEIALACERRFEAAERSRDAGRMGEAILELHSALTAWATDTDSGTAVMADAVLRSLVVRLVRLAESGLDDPYQRFAPLVEPLLAVRERLREERAWEFADTLRDALTTGGIEVRDTPEGTVWKLMTPSPAGDPG